MRVNAVNLLRHSARAVDPARDHGAYAFMLNELANMLEAVRDGKHTWEELAEACCLTERDRRST